MNVVLAWLGWAILFLGLAMAGLWLLGPREPVVTDIRFDASALSQGVDAYLAQQEARFDDITPGVEKQVVWANGPEQKTPLSIVYLHGFSATAQEVRPLPDLVAQALGANLVFTRLAGHGRSSEAMAEPEVEHWMHDVAEALAIAHRIGDRVVVLGTSTGATLAALAAHEDMGVQMSGVVLIAPNFRVNNPAAALLTWPAARWWLPVLAGKDRVFEPRNKGQEQYWTTRYPSIATLPMGAAVKAARALPHEQVETPALFIFDDKDQVVDHVATREVAARWGAASQMHVVHAGPEDDSYAHVIAGDIMSPTLTAPTAERIVEWVRNLP